MNCLSVFDNQCHHHLLDCGQSMETSTIEILDKSNIPTKLLTLEALQSEGGVQVAGTHPQGVIIFFMLF